MGRLLNNKEIGEAVLSATRLGESNETGWQAIRRIQDTSSLKAVGDWLYRASTSDRPMPAIVKGIVELKQGRMPEEIK